MAERPQYMACMACRLIFRPEQVEDGRCVQCQGVVRVAPEKLIQIKKEQLRRKRTTSRKNSNRLREELEQPRRRRTTRQGRPKSPSRNPRHVENTRRDYSGPGHTQIVPPSEVQAIRPTRKKKSGSSINSVADAPVDPIASADELLSALQSAPIPDLPATDAETPGDSDTGIIDSPQARRHRQRSGRQQRPKPVPQRRSGGSLFIPLDSIQDEAAPKQAGPDLFGESINVGGSGFTEQTARARKGELGQLDKPMEFGEYQLKEVLGKGGMGVVYKAEQTSLKRAVALKVMSIQNINPEDKIRFQREARAAARLHHPYIVPIFDIGNHNGHDYFTLEFIKGTDLHKLATNRKLSERQSLEIVQKVADAIGYAHGEGVIHRDLKPQNILIDDDGDPHVTDFGLAKDVQDAVNLTRTGIALGSPPYMPPEQALGNYSQVDQISDVYGLGAILYECLTGRPPFIGQTAYEILARVQTEDPRKPSAWNASVSQDAELICLKAMDKVKSARYQSAEDMARDLERALHGEPILARPPSLTRKVAQRIVKYRTQFASAALSVAFVLSMFLMVLLSNNESPELSKDAIPFVNLHTDQKGGAFDRAMLALSQGREDEALKQLAQVFRNKAPDEWLAKANDLVRGDAEDNREVLRRALKMAQSRSELKKIRGDALLDALVHVSRQVPEASFEGFLATAEKLLTSFIDDQTSSETEVTDSKKSWAQRLDGMAWLQQSTVEGLNRGDMELARDAFMVLLVNMHVQTLRTQASQPEVLSFLVEKMAKGPPQLIYPLSRSYLIRQRPEQREPFLQALGQQLPAEWQALLANLKDLRSEPTLDPETGRFKASDKQFNEARWIFPPFKLSDKREELAFASSAERRLYQETRESGAFLTAIDRALFQAKQAIYPSNPILGPLGTTVFFGWLNQIYQIDDRDGKILKRLRVPGRILSLRSYTQNRLVAVTVRPQGRDSKQPCVQQFIVDPNSGSIQWKATDDERTRDLPAQDTVNFHPALQFSYRAECDLFTSWTEYSTEQLFLSSKRARILGSSAEEDNPENLAIKAEIHRKHETFIQETGEFLSKHQFQPWIHVRRAASYWLDHDDDKATIEAAKALQQALQNKMDPLEQIELGVELSRFSWSKGTPDLFQRAYRRLVQDYGYVPEYAGYGAVDPGVLLSQLLDNKYVRGLKERRFNDRALPKETLENIRILEGWRDAFAPALTSSENIYPVRRIALSGQLKPPLSGPAPLLRNSSERLPRGYANMGAGTLMLFVVAVDFVSARMILLFLIFGILTWLRIRKQQLRDLAIFEIRTFKERVESFWKHPWLRLQYSYWSYLTLRDRVALLVILLLIVIFCAVHDSILLALDTRERAPQALFSGFPGHSTSLEFLVEESKSSKRPPHTLSMLAYGLHKTGENQVAALIYEDLAHKRKAPNAFNAAMLYEFSSVKDELHKMNLASKLDNLLDSEHPERYWARWLLTGDITAQEQAFNRANRRFSLIDVNTPNSLVLVQPKRIHRDKLSINGQLWYRLLPMAFVKNLFGLQSTTDIQRATFRVFGRRDLQDSLAVENSSWLSRFIYRLSEDVRLRKVGYAAIPGALLMVIASLLLPVRPVTPQARKLDTMQRRLDMLVPGFPQIMRGYCDRGIILAILLNLFALKIVLGDVLQGVIFQPFVVTSIGQGQFAYLIGESKMALGQMINGVPFVGPLTFKLKVMFALLATIIYVIHLLDLRTLHQRDDERYEASLNSQAPQTTAEPALLNS